MDKDKNFDRKKIDAFLNKF